MPEALTESFCERCGTRYEFAAPTTLNTVRKTRGLISGLKNYIMSQDALSDAVGDAMRSEEADLAAQQLEAFHSSFNFCITCRQYACTNCWNDDAGRCRTCVPIPGTDDLRERFEASFHASHPDLADRNGDMGAEQLQQRLGVDAWPSSDLPQQPAEPAWPEEPAWPAEPPMAEPLVAATDATPEQPVPEEPVFAPPMAEPLVAATDATPEQPIPGEPEAPMLPEIVPEPVAAEAPDLAAGAPAPQAVPDFAWETDSTWEPLPEPVPEPEPMVAAEPEAPAEPAAVPESLPEAPRPIRPQRPTPISPVSETILHMPRPAAPPEPTPAPPGPSEEERIPAAAAADDPALAARRAQLDLLGLGDPGEGPVEAGRANVLPYRSRGAAPTPSEISALQQAGVTGTGFWEASAREVAGAMSHIGVQSCGECGLSLSASARFCRRCGTPQARSA